MVPHGFNMVIGLEPFHNVSQAAKRALDPLSSRSKDHGTHTCMNISTFICAFFFFTYMVERKSIGMFGSCFLKLFIVPKKMRT